MGISIDIMDLHIVTLLNLYIKSYIIGILTQLLLVIVQEIIYLSLKGILKINSLVVVYEIIYLSLG